METEAPNINVWNLLSSATAGILTPNCSQPSVNESRFSSKNNSEDDVQGLASVVNFSPVEGENIMERVSSNEYKPQICIESGDYVTIVYKKSFPQSENLVNASIREENCPIHVDTTISLFSKNESYHTNIDSVKEDWSQKGVETKFYQGKCSFFDDSETQYTCESFYLDDLYVTAMENCSSEEKTSEHSFAHLTREESVLSTTSVVCGCNVNSHSRTSCPNTTKFDISFEDTETIPANYKEFVTELHSTESSIRNQTNVCAEIKEKLERTNSANRRNKRFLDHSLKKKSSSMNDSFPETIFPVRKRFHMSSTPALKAKNNLRLKYVPKDESPNYNHHMFDVEE